MKSEVCLILVPEMRAKGSWMYKIWSFHGTCKCIAFVTVYVSIIRGWLTQIGQYVHGTNRVLSPFFKN